MKKIVRLTESDLVRLVKRVINEQTGTISSLKIGDKILVSNKSIDVNQLKDMGTL